MHRSEFCLPERLAIMRTEKHTHEMFYILALFFHNHCNLKALVKRLMIVDDSWARASIWPPTIVRYHLLSSTIIQFELVQILHDSGCFSRLTTRMIVQDSFSVSCFVFTGPIAVRKHAAAIYRREKLILLQVCLMGCHLVFAFSRGKSLELAALVTFLARLPVNYRQLSRTSLAVWPVEW